MGAENGIKIYELYGLWYEPFWKHPYFIIFLILFILLILTLFVWIIKKIKAKRKVIQDPWQEALTQLKALDLTLFQDQETHKIFYSHLTSILKNYLSQRYDLMLEGKTDQEVVMLLANSSFPSDLHNYLKPIMQEALTIKFANYYAAIERMRYDLMHSIDIVRNTIPIQKK